MNFLKFLLLAISTAILIVIMMGIFTGNIKNLNFETTSIFMQVLILGLLMIRVIDSKKETNI